jgi:FK506-binding protein 4/5
LGEFVVDADGFGPEGREATGSEGAVPPNATLTVDLEVISWNAVDNVTDDNVVVKKIIRQGESSQKPSDGSTVKGITLFSSA